MKINGITIDVERKPIKNIHLAVYPPDARVHVSSPDYLEENDIRSFVISKWEWVKKQISEILSQPRQTNREFITGETHYLLGIRYRLRVYELPRVSHTIHRKNKWLIMTVQPGTTTHNRGELLREYQRSELKKVLNEIVLHMSNSVNEPGVTWEVKQMKTQWGSCIAKKRHLIFNLELSRVNRLYIEYVVMHELTHLKIANHNKMFELLMNQRMPLWRNYRTELNKFIALSME